MKKIYTLVFVLFSIVLKGQTGEKVDGHWGFSAGLETQTLGVQSLDGKEPDQTAVYSERNRPGMTLGANYRNKLIGGMSFQVGFTTSVLENKVSFRPGGTELFHFTDVELPVYLSYANPKSTNERLRGIILLGARAGWNVAQQESQNLRFLRERFAIDLGLGVEIRLGKWLLTPEVIYSHGLNNLHDFTGTNFDYLVGRAVRDKLAFKVVFFLPK